MIQQLVSLAVVLALLPACSKPLPPDPNLEAWKALPAQDVRSWDDLVLFEGPTELARLATNLALQPGETTLDGAALDGSAALRDQLRGKTPPRLLWSIGPDIPVERILAAATVAQGAGFDRFSFLVEVPLLEKPAYPHPEFAKEALTQITSLPAVGQTRQSHLQEMLTGEGNACKTASDVFISVAEASPEAKKDVLNLGIEQIRAKCDRGMEILTLLFLSSDPGVGGRPVGALEREWSAEAKAIEIPAGTPWRVIVPLIAAAADGQVRLVTSASEGAEPTPDSPAGADRVGE